ncbi:oligoribonuclease [Agrococcus sediminis]|uniref:Oligoribonuclease n=1 Tax=Agrococcus sediminis TaxID=2599924 RepID=A0A5M8QFM9_9MICO|nr:MULTISPECIES: oligoribonuclease [Agrococcus]KAA6433911.1 oligoribonuclease [Agrococcus sediminis]MDR7234435.1 oligoribonuclease [Agrococcus sp. BE272]RWR20331.1 oligoribonuclease [Agrococcus lahaulensis]UOW00678.1 oligoribonuclease [Agrococcus sp. SCSIO52902]
MAASDRIVWIDCEMTGLDPSVDELVEIAVVVTDFELEVLDPGLQIVIKPSDAALEQMGDFVRQMHATSGLDAEIPHGMPLAEAELEVLAYVQRFVPLERTAPLGGNTIGTDRMFLARYMPVLDGFLHYRSIDVSSIKELSRRWFPRAYFQAPEKAGGHRALADILESIRELRYYRRAVFTDAPGRASDELQAIARDVSDGFGAHLPG